MSTFMDKTFENKRLALQERLMDIDKTTSEPMQKCVQSCNAATTIFLEVIDHIKQAPFRDKYEEIYFLKSCCPFFISEIIYHQQLSVHIQSQTSIKSPKKFKEYCKRQLKSIKRYVDSYGEFITYHSSGLSNKDEEYVLSPLSSFQLPIVDTCIILNRDYISDYPIIIGRYIALLKISQRLTSDYKSLKIEPFYPEVIPTRENEEEMSWTETKVAAVELINALVSHKCINNGNCSIKQVVSHFESCFNTKIGNYYDIFSEIKARKNPTLFIDKMKSSFIQKVNEEC